MDASQVDSELKILQYIIGLYNLFLRNIDYAAKASFYF